MTNFEIENRLFKLVRDERHITNEILGLINLADGRKLYLEKGFPSLFEWLTQTFGYSESAAHRRIQAARLLRAVPEVAPKIASGEVNLTTLAKAQSMIRLQEKVCGTKLSPTQKTQVVAAIENKSGQETEKSLLKMFPQVASKVHEERTTAITENVTRLAVNLPNTVLKDLKRVQELLSHAVPGGTMVDVIQYLASDYIKRQDPRNKKPVESAKKLASKMGNSADVFANKFSAEGAKKVSAIDPAKMRASTFSSVSSDLKKITISHGNPKGKESDIQAQQTEIPKGSVSTPRKVIIQRNGDGVTGMGAGTVSQNTTLTSTKANDLNRVENTAATKRRVIGVSAKLKKEVLARAQGRCGFKDHSTGRVCGSSYQVEVDHIYPKALGGEDSIENLRCLCRNHNQFVAAQVLGGTAHHWRTLLT